MRKIQTVFFMTMTVALASAETVDLSIQYPTHAGQSVFVTAPHPRFGDGDVTKAIKLAPSGNGMWSLGVQMPPDTDLEFSYYVRYDSPDRLSDPRNGRMIGSVRETTAPVGAAPQRITVLQDGRDAEVRVTSRQGLHISIPLLRTQHNGQVSFSGTVNAIHRAHGHEMEVFVDGRPVLTDSAPTRCHAAPLFYRDGQAYHYLPTKPASEPRVVEFEFTPEGFRPRRISVMLPRGYDQNSTRYPVVYVEDGVYAMTTWRVDDTIVKMTERGELPEVIVVAIDNTRDRSAEYTPEYATFDGVRGRGDEYITAIRDGLVPIINRSYRTNTDPSETLHVGRSLGGLLGYHIVRNHEDVWGSVIAMSTVFKVELGMNIAFSKLPIGEWGRLYIDSGTAGDDNDDYSSNVLVRDSMIRNGHLLGERFYHTVGNDHWHDDRDWQLRVPEAMRWWAGPLLDRTAQEAMCAETAYTIANK